MGRYGVWHHLGPFVFDVGQSIFWISYPATPDDASRLAQVLFRCPGLGLLGLHLGSLLVFRLLLCELIGLFG